MTSALMRSCSSGVAEESPQEKGGIRGRRRTFVAEALEHLAQLQQNAVSPNGSSSDEGVVSERCEAQGPKRAIMHNGRWYHNSMRVPFAVRQISALVGCGVIATAPIAKDTVIFLEKDVVEEDHTRAEAVAMLEKLPMDERRRVLHHSYGSKREGAEVFSWCRDTAALFNHSMTPNFAPDGRCGEPETVWSALRDIDADEDGEGQWFTELFPALLDGEMYPDHTKWSARKELELPVAMTWSTARCRLRPFVNCKADAEFLASHWGNAQVTEFMTECFIADVSAAHAMIAETLSRSLRDGGLANHVVESLAEPGRPIGTCGAWFIASSAEGDKVAEEWNSDSNSGLENVAETAARTIVREIEIGFDLDPSCWGTGLATELALGLVAFLRADERWQDDTVVAYVDELNLASQCVCRKAKLINVGLRDMMGQPAIRFEL